MVEGDSTSDEVVLSDLGSGHKGGMSFTEHLEEFRTRIIYAIIFLILGCIVAFPFIKPFVFPWLMKPILAVKEAELQVLAPTEKFISYFKVGIVTGFVISLPFILHQLWLFIKPGLREKEQRWVKGLLWAAVFLFLGGAAFCFYLILPVALGFLLSFNLGFDINTEITLGRYFSFTLFLILAGGIVFQIPLVTFFLSMVGLVSPAQMVKFRKYAVLAAVVLAAALTPTGDPVTLAMMGVPIYLLYEISILVSKAVYRKKEETAERVDGEVPQA